MDAGTESGADSEDGEEDIGDVVGQQPSVELGQRRHDKWPNRQAKIVHGDDQGTENTAFILKVLHSFFHSRGGNGRPKSAAICLSVHGPWLDWRESTEGTASTHDTNVMAAKTKTLSHFLLDGQLVAFLGSPGPSKSTI